MSATSVIEIGETVDEDYIREVFLNPVIYDNMRDDSCPTSPDNMWSHRVMDIPGFFLKAVIDEIPVGAFWLIWKDGEVEAHTALLPHCRGRDAIRVTKAAIDWVFGNTEAKAITSYAWSDMPAVAWFCRAVGMQSTGSKPWDYTRRGKSVNITYFRIEKPLTT